MRSLGLAVYSFGITLNRYSFFICIELKRYFITPPEGNIWLDLIRLFWYDSRPVYRRTSDSVVQQLERRAPASNLIKALGFSVQIIESGWSSAPPAFLRLDAR